MTDCQKPEGYKFRVDKTKYVSEERFITGLKLLEYADVSDVSKYGLYQKNKGQGMVRIEDLEADIDLAIKGLERFVTLPLEQQEGETLLKVECLPKEDREFLDEVGWAWEVHTDGAANWLIIYDFPVPSGYTHEITDVSLRLESCYPDTQIDMVYFGNQLALIDGRQIGALAAASHLGRDWQRWSRHRTAENPWRMGIDGVATHMALVQHWLERELKRD